MYTQHIVFKVMACSDVHVGLASYPGIFYAQMYEVIIGGWDNKKSAIRKEVQGTIMVEVEKDNVLDCNQYRSLWVSWYDGTIMMGEGVHVGESILLSWKDLYPHPVTAVAFTNAAGWNGTWEVQLVQGE